MKSKSKNFDREFTVACKGGNSLFHCETMDTQALIDTLVDICSNGDIDHFDSEPRKVFRWGPASGIECVYYGQAGVKNSEGKWQDGKNLKEYFNNAQANKDCSAVSLLERMLNEPCESNTETSIPPSSVIVVEFMDAFCENMVLLQSIIDGITGACGAKRVFRRQRICIVFTAPVLNMNKQLLKYSMPLTLDLPTEEDIRETVKSVMEIGKGVLSKKMERLTKEQQEQYADPWYNHEEYIDLIVPHLKGLTELSVVCACRQAIVYHSGSDVEPVIKYISNYKMQVVANSKVLRFLPYNEQEDEKSIGGFDNFLEWIKLRRHIFSAEGERQNIDPPKGVVLLGRPGTGKSLAAKAMGKMLGDLPVIVMDVSALFGSLVGESEARVREALNIIDGINGCVLLIDEADKAFAGNNSGTSGDSGTSQRVLGNVLNWLNDHKSKTFVVMTLNRIDTLPPELLRAGRFDKMFYTDLPSPKERRQILEIHLKKRLDPIDKMVEYTDDEWLDICEATDRFVGAELEEVVKDARLEAFNNTGDATPTAKDILEACNSRTAMAESDAVSKEVMKQCMKIATPVFKRG